MLYLHHSNNINTLKDRLVDQLEAHSSRVLQAEQILVQNPGMKRWLQQQVSKNSGIAANLQFPLPSRFIWDIFLDQFEQQDLSAFDADVMRWSLLQILHQQVNSKELVDLQPYLQQDSNGLAQFQLAQKLASLFDQYLVYRPQMIASWERDTRPMDKQQAWQAFLWHSLRQHSQQPHRAELIQRLIGLIDSSAIQQDKLPSRLFVFALSAMSPLYMNVLAALGQIIDVHIFVVNPCRHYWGDLQSRKEQIKQGVTQQVENELLASLGQQGRDYIDQFYDSNFTYQDLHHFSSIEPDCLLKLIQHNMLEYSDSKPTFDVEKDNSIEVVSCYSELRELQVLHDYLLKQLATDPELQPHDIVVMCPDINTLAPYIDAVFGQQAENRKLAYSISDQQILSSSPLLQVMLDWIQLPNSRFTASEIMAWLEVPELQSVYQLDESAVDIIRFWISDNRIHWALDAEHKQKMGFGAQDLHSWAHGISRLLTAYVMPPSTALYQDQVASSIIMGSAELKVLGQLQKLLDDLAKWQQKLSQNYSLSQWQQNINAMIDQLLQVDENEDWIIKLLRDELSNWKEESEHAGFEQPIDASLVHYLLKQSLQQGSAHHYYLSGGINFCNLIPMRTLPFKVVCLIGMGDVAFPRQEVSLQFDLIARHPQKGDRSRREDDRYMFLQSILSAQYKLYISYVGRDKRDDSTLEPSVVVNELIDHVHKVTGYQLSIRQTALQPFSVKNFSQGSYAEQWKIKPDKKPVSTFNQPVAEYEIDDVLVLDELIRFFRNPAQYYLQQRLGILLVQAQTEIQDDETFNLDGLDQYQLRQSLFSDMMQDSMLVDEKFLNSGQLSEQNIGLLQLQAQKQDAEQSYQTLISDPGYSGLCSMDYSVELSRCRLQGRIQSYSDSGFLQITESKMKGKSLVGFWLKHCLMCTQSAPDFSRVLFRDGQVTYEPVEKTQALDYLQLCISTYQQGMQQALSFYPDTAFEYQNTLNSKSHDDALNKIEKLWQPDAFYPSLEYTDPYIQTALQQQQPFNDSFFQLSETLLQPMIAAMKVSS